MRIIIVELRFRPRRRIWKNADILFHLLQGLRAVTNQAHFRIFRSRGHKMAFDTGGVCDLGAWLRVRIARDLGLLGSRVLMAVVAFEFLRLSLSEHAPDLSCVRRVLEFRVVDLLISALRARSPGLAGAGSFLRGGVG